MLRVSLGGPSIFSSGAGSASYRDEADKYDEIPKTPKERLSRSELLNAVFGDTLPEAEKLLRYICALVK
jgi:hypothetical protein